MRTITEYVQRCHIQLYQKIARKKVARVNAALCVLFSSFSAPCFGNQKQSTSLPDYSMQLLF